MKITKNIHNTDIPKEIQEGKLVEGRFVVTGEGHIIPFEGIKKKIYQWLQFDPRNPIQLGKLLAKDENNPNKDYLVNCGFAVLDEKSSISEKVRQSFQRLRDEGHLDGNGKSGKTGTPGVKI